MTVDFNDYFWVSFIIVMYNNTDKSRWQCFIVSSIMFYKYPKVYLFSSNETTTQTILKTDICKIVKLI